MTRPGHRQSLSPAQARVLASPAMRFDPLPHNAEAVVISNPALFRWKKEVAR